MSHTAVVKIAPIFSVERFDDPRWNRPGRTMYYNGALKFLPGKASIPLIVDHDDSCEIGTVHELFKLDWLDGSWVCARATVNTPPAWLKRGTRASFGFLAPDRREINIRGTKAEVIAWAIVNEVSVLSAAKSPAEPCAEVLSYRPAQAPSSPAAGADRTVAGDTYDERPPVWDELERIVGYRVTDANQEQAFTEANRSPLARAHAALVAKRNEPQVLVRPGIGQVLGVR